MNTKAEIQGIASICDPVAITMVRGLLVSLPQTVRSEVIAAGIAASLGRAMSLATASPDIAEVLKLRAAAEKEFAAALRGFAPAVQPAQSLVQ